MAALLSRGLVLDQHKEPALSRDLREFSTAPSEPLASLLPAEDPDGLAGRDILAYARQAEIIDERDGIPLAVKLEEGQGAGILAADAMDDEPYVSSQLNPLFKLSQQAVEGLFFAARAVGAPNTRIAVYKNMSDVQMHIPNTLYGVKIKRITGKYPVEARSLYFEKGESSLLVGVGALIHLYRAVHRAVKQTTAFVTVAGNCVANAQNLEVTCGTAVQQVLERCGLIEDPGRVVVGGPMTGQCVADPAGMAVGPATRAVLAFRSDARDRRYRCIGCGKCARVCPQKLSPVYLFKAAQARHVRLLRTFDATSCIGCGTCSYICPAKLDLSAGIREAARVIRELDGRAIRTGEANEIAADL